MVKRKGKDRQKYILPLFVIASSLVFATVFVILLAPAVLTRFGFEPILIMMLVVSGTLPAMLAILFYLILKRTIAFR